MRHGQRYFVGNPSKNLAEAEKQMKIILIKVVVSVGTKTVFAEHWDE